MSELQRGTAVIPTIDAGGEVMRLCHLDQLREMVRHIDHLPLTLDFGDTYVRFLFESKGINTDGTKTGYVPVAQIVNLKSAS